MFEKKIKSLLSKVLKKLQKKEKVCFKLGEIEVETPKEKNYGDYSSNVALKTAKFFNKTPTQLAKEIEKELEILNQKIYLFEKIKIEGPGFINFFISEKFLKKALKKILFKNKKFPEFKKRKEKVLLEFISANPTGPLHIGNGRGAFFGDCLAKILERLGYKVQREYFINDAKHNSQIRELGKTALGTSQSYLNEYLKKKIEKLRNKLKNLKEEEAGFLLANEIQKDIQHFIRERLKIKFDKFVSEQKLFDKGKAYQILNQLEKMNLVYEKEGAEWLRLSQFGLPKDEVLIRKDGSPTYFLSDITYHKNKIERGFKKIINIWGADHQGHVERMKVAMKILRFKGKFEILISQIVTLKGGEKLSKRKGKVIFLEDLIEEIGLDACRFFYLTRSLSTPLDFDIELAKEKSQSNPLFYIQYAHARICSVLKKVKKYNLKKINWKLLSHPKEIELIKKIIQFPDIIQKCSRDYELQRIPNYAREIATTFHQFYEECKIIGDKKNLTQARLALVLATKIVLKEVLDLMGISAPERM
jgi:arginyl-tRNA synthetase